MSFQYSPTIVIGMHRSGTTMVCRLLEDLGLLVGNRKDDNHEARFFHNINLWLFSQSGARWDNPSPVHYLIRNEEARALAVNYIRRHLMTSPRTASYLGWAKYLKYRSIFHLDIPWGWKSPLNTFTLPIWLDLFPNAKVIHIYRHGVDVANSLRVRGRKDMQQNWSRRLYYRLRPLHWVWPKQGDFMASVRCHSLRDGLTLWEEYMSEARTAVEQLGERALELKYEDFLAEPLPALVKLAQFCGLPADHAAVQQAAASVKQERAFAYRTNHELKQFADHEAQRLAAQHY